MARTQNCLCKKIKFRPSVVYFKPQGVSMRCLDVVELSLEEIESYRLKYIDDLEQKLAAQKMGTSHSTYQRILKNACKKIADALINGKVIKIIKHE